MQWCVNTMLTPANTPFEPGTRLDIPIYDASYIALAKKHDTKAYTADENLLDDLDGDDSELAEHIKTYP